MFATKSRRTWATRCRSVTFSMNATTSPLSPRAPADTAYDADGGPKMSISRRSLCPRCAAAVTCSTVSATRERRSCDDRMSAATRLVNNRRSVGSDTITPTERASSAADKRSRCTTSASDAASARGSALPVGSSERRRPLTRHTPNNTEASARSSTDAASTHASRISRRRRAERAVRGERPSPARGALRSPDT